MNRAFFSHCQKQARLAEEIIMACFYIFY